MTTNDTFNLECFYPNAMNIISSSINGGLIQLSIKSNTHEAICPVCKKKSSSYHSTYHRKVQDLPILGKKVILDITAYRYYCDNIECKQKVFAEELEGFAGWYRRKTERLEDMIITIAVNTSCEGCSRICSHMGVDVSGDAIIRLIKRYSKKKESFASEIIGIDDWAYKKGHTYGTIICDGKTHKPIDLLDGRDGQELKKWLLNNKYVKIITRDRASAYAKVISEVLPDAMQIADRFHLHQNLLNEIKDSFSRELPNKIEISEAATDSQVEKVKAAEVKKKSVD